MPPAVEAWNLNHWTSREVPDFFFFTVHIYYLLEIKNTPLGFPGGAVVGNLPANAGDTGSCPGQGGSHMPQSN